MHVTIPTNIPGHIGGTLGSPWTNPYPPNQPAPYRFPSPPSDYTLNRVRQIVAAYEARLVTKAEARKMLAALDPAFATVLKGA
jgi:hypothetical protein